jgi:hypothetical protein
MKLEYREPALYHGAAVDIEFSKNPALEREADEILAKDQNGRLSEDVLDRGWASYDVESLIADAEEDDQPRASAGNEKDRLRWFKDGPDDTDSAESDLGPLPLWAPAFHEEIMLVPEHRFAVRAMHHSENHVPAAGQPYKLTAELGNFGEPNAISCSVPQFMRELGERSARAGVPFWPRAWRVYVAMWCDTRSLALMAARREPIDEAFREQIFRAIRLETEQAALAKRSTLNELLEAGIKRPGKNIWGHVYRGEEMIKTSVSVPAEIADAVRAACRENMITLSDWVVKMENNYRWLVGLKMRRAQNWKPLPPGTILLDTNPGQWARL